MERETGTVKLKNGKIADEEDVAREMVIFQEWYAHDDTFLIIDELLKQCKNPDHEILPFIKEKIEPLGWLDQDGRILEDPKNILLSAAEGDELNWVLVDPKKASAKSVTCPSGFMLATETKYVEMQDIVTNTKKRPRY